MHGSTSGLDNIKITIGGKEISVAGMESIDFTPPAEPTFIIGEPVTHGVSGSLTLSTFDLSPYVVEWVASDKERKAVKRFWQSMPKSKRRRKKALKKWLAAGGMNQ